MILPTAVRGAVRQERPVVVIVGGQPGAGKTAVADLVQAALETPPGCGPPWRTRGSASHASSSRCPGRVPTASRW
ncbi:zeta toxin family protein [Streptomyces griseofuscus]|uniref:zeta toxin family protein n=1 Tax=Streptomyces griseofuscus TaxID=146922 RepID=UPI00369AC8F6